MSRETYVFSPPLLAWSCGRITLTVWKYGQIVRFAGREAGSREQQLCRRTFWFACILSYPSHPQVLLTVARQMSLVLDMSSKTQTSLKNEARQQSDENWRAAFENSAIGITMADLDSSAKCWVIRNQSCIN